MSNFDLLRTLDNFNRLYYNNGESVPVLSAYPTKIYMSPCISTSIYCGKCNSSAHATIYCTFVKSCSVCKSTDPKHNEDQCKAYNMCKHCGIIDVEHKKNESSCNTYKCKYCGRHDKAHKAVENQCTANPANQCPHCNLIDFSHDQKLCNENPANECRFCYVKDYKHKPSECPENPKNECKYCGQKEFNHNFKKCEELMEKITQNVCNQSNSSKRKKVSFNTVPLTEPVIVNDTQPKPSRSNMKSVKPVTQKIPTKREYRLFEMFMEFMKATNDENLSSDNEDSSINNNDNEEFNIEIEDEI